MMNFSYQSKQLSYLEPVKSGLLYHHKNKDAQVISFFTRFFSEASRLLFVGILFSFNVVISFIEGLLRVRSFVIETSHILLEIFHFTLLAVLDYLKTASIT